MVSSPMLAPLLMPETSGPADSQQPAWEGEYARRRACRSRSRKTVGGVRAYSGERVKGVGFGAVVVLRRHYLDICSGT